MINKLQNLREARRKGEGGFTIIEVLIVLAIAGLIMLIVFLAVPALQRNSRNTSRRSDASHLAGLINEYAANHAGTLPTGVGTGAGNIDLSGEKWSIMTAPVTANIVTTNAFPTNNTTMNVNKGFKCDQATNALTASSSRSFAITMKVESGGADQDVCING